MRVKGLAYALPTERVDLFIVVKRDELYQVRHADLDTLPIREPRFFPSEQLAGHIRYAIALSRLLAEGGVLFGIERISDHEIHIHPEFFKRSEVHQMVSRFGDPEEDAPTIAKPDGWGTW